MSDLDHLLLHDRRAVAEVAGEVAEVVGGELRDDGGQGIVVVRRRPRDGVAWIGGLFAGNAYADPEEGTALDGFALAWDLGIPVRDEAVLHACSRELFDRLAGTGRWPVLLLRGTSMLVAARLPGEAVAEFAPGVTPDAADRVAWLPHVPPA